MTRDLSQLRSEIKILNDHEKRLTGFLAAEKSNPRAGSPTTVARERNARRLIKRMAAAGDDEDLMATAYVERRPSSHSRSRKRHM
jgi:hypothetical protein